MVLDFFTATFDVTAAFLEGSADCRMFARLPLCLSSIRERVEIVGNWYGLKQGPKIWNDQLNAILLELEFVRCPVHPCLYTRLRNKVFIILGVHVDDGLMGCNQETEFELFLTEFNEQKCPQVHQYRHACRSRSAYHRAVVQCVHRRQDC